MAYFIIFTSANLVKKDFNMKKNTRKKRLFLIMFADYLCKNKVIDTENSNVTNKAAESGSESATLSRKC